MACLEGLPVMRKAGPAGLRAQARARSAYGGTLPARSLGGPAAWPVPRPGPIASPPRLPGHAYTRPGTPHGRETDEASAAGGPVRGVRAASQARADRRRGTGRLAADRRGDPSGPGRRRREGQADQSAPSLLTRPCSEISERLVREDPCSGTLGWGQPQCLPRTSDCDVRSHRMDWR